MSDLVGNPEDLLSRVAAHFSSPIKLRYWNFQYHDVVASEQLAASLHRDTAIAIRAISRFLKL